MRFVMILIFDNIQWNQPLNNIYTFSQQSVLGEREHRGLCIPSIGSGLLKSWKVMVLCPEIPKGDKKIYDRLSIKDNSK